MGGFVMLQCMGFPYDDQYSLLGCGIGGASTNIPLAQWTPVVAGKFTKMKIRITSLNDFTIDVPVTLRKNGQATTAGVTIAASAINTTYTWSGEVSVAENDAVDLHYNVAGADGWEAAYLTMVFEFQPS